MTFRFQGLVLASGIALAGTALAAAEQAPDLSIRVKQYTANYKINEDGTYVTERSRAITVLKEQAVSSAKQTSISYSTSVEKSEILAAYTLKPDGRRIDAPAGNFQVDASGSKDQGAAAAFSDRTTLSVIFPDVAVGDTVVLSYRVTTTDPIFPKQFSTLESFSKTAAYDEARIKIDAPASMWTQFQTKDLQEVQNQEKDGRRILEWRWENKTPLKSKRSDYSVYDREQEPGFSFSTFKSYAEIAESYGQRARPKAAVTERVQKLADEIAKDQKTPQDIARALYDWVAVNIGYAGNCVGIGAVVPRDLDFVIGNRLGDCKDHATLLQALLAAKGIQSTQALINAGSAYKLQKVPVVAMVNHVITYIPSMNLYLDSTSETTPFGMLPFSDADKPVLLIDGYKEGSRTSKIPPTLNTQTLKMNVKIGEDGSVKGSAAADITGHLAVSSRDYFRDLSKEDEADLLKNYFKYQGFEGEGTVKKDDPKALLSTHRYSADFNVQSRFEMPGPSALVVEPLIFSYRPVSAYVASLIQPQEEVESIACLGGLSVEEYAYDLPKGVKVTALPPDLKLQSGVYAYTATYKRVGQKLTVKRTFDDRTEGNVCATAELKTHKAFADKVMRNLRTQVIFQPAK